MTATTNGPVSGPPANTFWTRYSPNGEALLSPLASALVHAGILALIMLGVIGFLRAPDDAVPIEPIQFPGDGRPTGPGGTLEGEGRTPAQVSRHDVSENLRDDRVVLAPPEIDAKVKAPSAPTISDEPNPDTRVTIPTKQDTNVGIYLKDLLPGKQPKGKDGKWAGFREGPGGPGTGPVPPRVARALRWEMLFRTDTHTDYLRQLNALGAFIGIPDTEGRLMIIRNLSERPANWQYEAIEDLDRVWWTDSRADSGRGVAEVLQLNVVPSMFYAFIPQAIEDQLAKTELDYAKRYGVTDENQIKETQFAVSFRGGKPVFTVKSQTRK